MICTTEAAPIKCDGRESVGRPTDSHIESAGRLTNSPTESVGKPADSLPVHFIGAARRSVGPTLLALPLRIGTRREDYPQSVRLRLRRSLPLRPSMHQITTLTTPQRKAKRNLSSVASV